MLKQDIRRKIDSARDILVGKVPDPKAQVEQITTALIYKFMDDRDKESEELGGKPSFFINEFEKYAWTKLFDTRLGGFERLNLYVEALLKMPQNKYIPQLFRDILKDAFLPYRDPETLSLFLKEMNYFTYDHSENLGDAYEYLLSVLGSQGDAGQFRTPRHIIDFIVEVIDPKKDETILDPACGTAGFLISGYKHILRQNTKESLGDQLTPDEKKKLMNHFMGYDIAPDMVRLSLTNMFLHSFPSPNIYEYDTLTSEERWDETYDVIMANPPFMSPKGGIRPHKRFTTQAMRSEVLFVDYIAEHLNVNGRAGVIVPEGIIFQSGSAYKSLRKMLVDDNYLYAVVSLPAGIFQPYSGVKTSILLMDKSLAKKTDSILFIKVSNDGFDLGAQRREKTGSDLPSALELLNLYKNSLQEGKDFEENILIPDAQFIIVEKKKLAKNGDYNLAGERYRETRIYANIKYPVVELGEIAQNLDSKRKPITKSDRTTGKYPYFGASGIVDYVDDYIFDEDLLLISEDGANLLTRNTPIAFSISGKNWVNNHAHVLKFQNIETQRFVEFLLNLMNLESYITGSAQPKINQDKLNSIKVPLPPLDIQQEIVAELDLYQKIIEGANQVVENYKPSVRIFPDWEIKPLGEVCDKITDGTHQTPTYTESGIIFLSSKNVTSGKIDWNNIKYISKELHEQLSKRVSPQIGDVLLAKSGTTGVAALVDQSVIFDIYESLALFRPKPCLAPSFLLHLLNSPYVESQFSSRIKGIGIKHLHLDELRQVQIPLPPLSIQEEIVTQIEEEQKLVEANKRLIIIFEQKIKDKIAEIWGEEISSIEDEAVETLIPSFG